MHVFKTTTGWTHNKNSESIIYPNADGSVTEITLAVFLADSPSNTVEMFKLLKETSDELFQAEESAESRHLKSELPLYDWSEKFVSGTLEDYYFDSCDYESQQLFLERRRQMIALVPVVLDKLTETQRRRLLLHKVKKLTTRKIAAMEGISFQSVAESITGAEKKIKKIMKKIERHTPKHPDKQEDY